MKGWIKGWIGAQRRKLRTPAMLLAVAPLSYEGGAVSMPGYPPPVSLPPREQAHAEHLSSQASLSFAVFTFPSFAYPSLNFSFLCIPFSPMCSSGQQSSFNESQHQRQVICIMDWREVPSGTRAGSSGQIYLTHVPKWEK